MNLNPATVLDGSVSASAARFNCAIKTAVAALHQHGIRIRAIIAAGEVIQRGERLIEADFEHGAQTVRADAVDISQYNQCQSPHFGRATHIQLLRSDGAKSDGPVALFDRTMA
jgi:hypothetical protein